MARQLTEADARSSLADHARAKGLALHARYRTMDGWDKIRAILNDREFVRYPCSLVFDAQTLEPGECAYPMPVSDHPEDGFTMVVHPQLADYPVWVLHVVLYQLVVVNYGDFAAAEDAEVFGAAALGLTVDQFYDRLCTLTDLVMSIDEGGVTVIPAPVSRS